MFGKSFKYVNICISKYANRDEMSITNHANVDQVDIINAIIFIDIFINSRLYELLILMC